MDLKTIQPYHEDRSDFFEDASRAGELAFPCAMCKHRDLDARDANCLCRSCRWCA